MADLSDEESLDNLAQRVGNKIGLSQFTDVSAAIQHLSAKTDKKKARLKKTTGGSSVKSVSGKENKGKNKAPKTDLLDFSWDSDSDFTQPIPPKSGKKAKSTVKTTKQKKCDETTKKTLEKPKETEPGSRKKTATKPKSSIKGLPAEARAVTTPRTGGKPRCTSVKPIGSAKGKGQEISSTHMGDTSSGISPVLCGKPKRKGATAHSTPTALVPQPIKGSTPLDALTRRLDQSLVLHERVSLNDSGNITNALSNHGQNVTGFSDDLFGEEVRSDSRTGKSIGRSLSGISLASQISTGDEDSWNQLNIGGKRNGNSSRLSVPSPDSFRDFGSLDGYKDISMNSHIDFLPCDSPPCDRLKEASLTSYSESPPCDSKTTNALLKIGKEKCGNHKSLESLNGSTLNSSSMVSEEQNVTENEISTSDKQMQVSFPEEDSILGETTKDKSLQVSILEDTHMSDKGLQVSFSEGESHLEVSMSNKCLQVSLGRRKFSDDLNTSNKSMQVSFTSDADDVVLETQSLKSSGSKRKSVSSDFVPDSLNPYLVKDSQVTRCSVSTGFVPETLSVEIVRDSMDSDLSFNSQYISSGDYVVESQMDDSETMLNTIKDLNQDAPYCSANQKTESQALHLHLTQATENTHVVMATASSPSEQSHGSMVSNTCTEDDISKQSICISASFTSQEDTEKNDKWKQPIKSSTVWRDSKYFSDDEDEEEKDNNYDDKDGGESSEGGKEESDFESEEEVVEMQSVSLQVSMCSNNGKADLSEEEGDKEEDEEEEVVEQVSVSLQVSMCSENGGDDLSEEEEEGDKEEEVVEQVSVQLQVSMCSENGGADSSGDEGNKEEEEKEEGKGVEQVSVQLQVSMCSEPGEKNSEENDESEDEFHSCDEEDNDNKTKATHKTKRKSLMNRKTIVLSSDEETQGTSKPAGTPVNQDSPEIGARRTSPLNANLDDSDDWLPTPIKPSVTQRQKGSTSKQKAVELSDSSEEDDFEAFLQKQQRDKEDAEQERRNSITDFVVDDDEISSDSDDSAFYINTSRKLPPAESSSHTSISIDVEKSLLERLGKSFRTPIKSTGKEKSPKPSPATSFPEGLGNRFRTPIKPTRKEESPEPSPAITILDSSPEFQPLFKTPKPLKTKTNKKALTEVPKKPASFSRPALVNQTRPKSADYGGTRFSFLKSLSDVISDDRRHIDAGRYVKNLKKTKEELTAKLFGIYNSSIFEDKLPSDLLIQWNARLLKTAGYCSYKKDRLAQRSCRIELSVKVCDTAERVRDTLVHELCHAAVWLLNGKTDGHGPYWKYWARKANLTHPDIPIIQRCHTYAISTKYTYKCTQCGYQLGRHSKSLDTEKKVCGYCNGRFELLVNQGSGKTKTPSTPRTPNRFAQFVKENYGNLKKANQGAPHKDIMKLLSAEFATKAKI